MTVKDIVYGPFSRELPIAIIDRSTDHHVFLGEVGALMFPEYAHLLERYICCIGPISYGDLEIVIQ